MISKEVVEKASLHIARKSLGNFSDSTNYLSNSINIIYNHKVMCYIRVVIKKQGSFILSFQKRKEAMAKYKSYTYAQDMLIPVSLKE